MPRGLAQTEYRMKEITDMRRYAGTLIMAATLVASSAVAQQQMPSASPGGGKSAGQIDCPAAGAAASGGTSAVGTPQGAGQGSGLTALPGKGSKRVEGPITAIGSTRTNRVVEVGAVKLEVEPTTAVLVDCKEATVADLKEGQVIKALYEVKANNRNVAMVIEAEE
jgi:hypothetical protein